QSMDAIDQIMSHIDEVNHAIQTIAMFTEQETERTEEMNARVEKLNKYFENTKQLTRETGASVYKAGIGVNNNRLQAIESIEIPTTKQQDRIDETSRKVSNWFAYNQTNGFA